MVERPKRAAGVVLALMMALGALAFAGYGQDPYGQEPGVGDGPDAAKMRLASDGAYTEEQADLGAEIYAASCAGCHGGSLEGGFGPRLQPLDPFVYLDQPVAVPFAFMREAMPFDAPGSLADEDYAAVLAYVLRENGYPPGEEPLPTDDEALDLIVLDELPAE